MRRRDEVVLALILWGVLYFVMPLVFGEEQMVSLKFYDEEGESNGEIYDLLLSENIEDALEKKTEIELDIEKYCNLMIASEDCKFEEALDPFTNEDIWCPSDWVGRRQMLSDLKKVINQYVLFVFSYEDEDDDESYYGRVKCYSVVKITK